MRPNDPRIRQRINQISHNFEAANETAQESIYTFSHNYISPCLGTVGHCISACTAPCLPSKSDQSRRRRRGRAEENFDFYDDWDNDIAGDGLLGWGHDELDRLLAGSRLSRGVSSEQPRRQRTMSYGARNTRRKNSVMTPDNRHDPTVIPSSSFLGFLERFPWRLGAKGLKYRPSAADLQEHPKGSMSRHAAHDEHEPLLPHNEGEEYVSYQGVAISDVDDDGSRRKRSGTNSSRETDTSLSSRGDLIPSDDEEDAVPLDDDLATALARRGMGFDIDDGMLGDKLPFKSSMSGKVSLATTASSKASKRKGKRKSTRKPSSRTMDSFGSDSPVIVNLEEEERQAEFQQESEIKGKRLAAHRLALSHGLRPDVNLVSNQLMLWD